MGEDRAARTSGQRLPNPSSHWVLLRDGSNKRISLKQMVFAGTLSDGCSGKLDVLTCTDWTLWPRSEHAQPFEEAIRSALAELGVSEDDQLNRAWKREDLLFDEFLTDASKFKPMDRASTRAAESGVRDHGNEVAHTGLAEDAHVNEVFVSILPRALQSLSAAVEARL